MLAILSLSAAITDSGQDIDSPMAMTTESGGDAHGSPGSGHSNLAAQADFVAHILHKTRYTFRGAEPANLYVRLPTQMSPCSAEILALHLQLRLGTSSSFPLCTKTPCRQH
jgi:hypothetical protein